MELRAAAAAAEVLSENPPRRLEEESGRENRPREPGAAAWSEAAAADLRITRCRSRRCSAAAADEAEEDSASEAGTTTTTTTLTTTAEIICAADTAEAAVAEIEEDRAKGFVGEIENNIKGDSPIPEEIVLRGAAVSTTAGDEAAFTCAAVEGATMGEAGTLITGIIPVRLLVEVACCSRGWQKRGGREMCLCGHYI